MNAKISPIRDCDCHNVTDCDGQSLGHYYPREFADRVALRVNLKEAARLVAATGNQKLRDEILDAVEAEQDTAKHLIVRPAGSYVSVSVSNTRVDVRRATWQDLDGVFATPLEARAFALQSGAKEAWFDDSVPADFRRQIILGVVGFPLPAAVTA